MDIYQCADPKLEFQFGNLTEIVFSKLASDTSVFIELRVQCHSFLFIEIDASFL